MQTLPEKKLTKMGLRSFSYEHLKIRNTKEAEASLGIRDFSFRYKNAKKKSLSIDALDFPKASHKRVNKSFALATSYLFLFAFTRAFHSLF